MLSRYIKISNRSFILVLEKIEKTKQSKKF